MTGKNEQPGGNGQYSMPVIKPSCPDGNYDIYPSFKIENDLIFTCFESLAERIGKHKFVIIDGYSGAFFHIFKERICQYLKQKNIIVSWTDTASFLKTEQDIEEMTAPFAGENDPLFGRKTTLTLEDFFIPGKLESYSPDPSADISILSGTGAFLSSYDGLRIYVDVPKNELQYRSRSGLVTNLGYTAPSTPKEMYRRFYFVDWVVLNNHKNKSIGAVDIFVDGQRPEMPVWIEGSTLRETLYQMSRNIFRARPWFEPGIWGGTWIRDNIKGLNTDVPNYAWSFELITPENGLLIESSSRLCEVSFDTVMYLNAPAVLGDCFERFGTQFPIRFDYLDTFNGGNLSVQSHPGPEYIKQKFGEDYTQEESYYIFDTKDNAGVFLGFRDDIDPELFRIELERSFLENKPLDPEDFILKHRVKKHDFLLVPYGTIHGSGTNNLVLEISTTPYIFTFKMYDWLRPDLDGKPRPLNVRRGMDNLYFARKGSYVYENLIAKPVMEMEGEDWKLFHLMTHETHSYDVRRYHFMNTIEIETNNKCLVFNLVEGTVIEVETMNGIRRTFSYAETFVVPAAAVSIRIINKSKREAILIEAFIK